MRNLILFFIKYSSVLLFIFYMIIGSFLLFENNPYQHHVLLTSANVVSSSVYKTSSNITGYFNLREINEDLLERNSALELEILNLKQKLRIIADYEELDTIKNPRYSFTLAHVINNSTNRPRNYITIDKGSEDGIGPEMGVVDHKGIVGIVNVVGPHSARVISLLNDHLRLSCRVKGYDYVGSLVWDGKKTNEAIMEELPRHAIFSPGDTIVTSGFSTVFPEGIPVGTVIEGLKDYDENFYALKVNLFTDFETLSTVRVIKDDMKSEIDEIEKDVIYESKLNKK